MELIQARADIGPKFLAESDFLRRLWIVRWYDRLCLVDRKTHLLGRSSAGPMGPPSESAAEQRFSSMMYLLRQGK